MMKAATKVQMKVQMKVLIPPKLANITTEVKEFPKGLNMNVSIIFTAKNKDTTWKHSLIRTPLIRIGREFYLGHKIVKDYTLSKGCFT